VDKHKNNDEPGRLTWAEYGLALVIIVIAIVVVLALLGPTMCGGVFSNISRGLSR